ncbi:MAG: DUF3667 domain-containing protein [Melioribacteraceae bacterium]
MRSKKKFTICPNCENKLTPVDHFCSQCGQQNHDLKIPFWHLVEEGIESFFHIDRKALVTLKLLILSPGELSKEFNEGRRVKFIPPIRLYVLISFLFFFLLNFSIPHSFSNEGKNSSLSISFKGLHTSELVALSKKQTDSLATIKKIPPTEFNKFWIDQLYKIANSSKTEFFHSLFKNISYMMFVLMPGFAFILHLFFRNKNSFYVESLIVSVHFHSFVFLLISVFLLVGLTKTIFAFLLTPILVPAYLFFVLRRYYYQKVFASIWKTTAIGVLHFILFASLFISTVFISIYLV